MSQEYLALLLDDDKSIAPPPQNSVRYPNGFNLILSCVIFVAYSQALDWCPFQRNVLASGGGTADRHIRFWNVGSGNCLSSIDTHSQVNYKIIKILLDASKPAHVDQHELK